MVRNEGNVELLRFNNKSPASAITKVAAIFAESVWTFPKGQ